ncbi:hypothetical protein CAQU_06300 [Corynebacterium aquilae DSM 44791]|uniref:Oxidoreductase n=1 Tax=Corynebacterium aquilae DSM 44791 TaxID=1431546 RepID=A0A1L7CFZ4_9CORY|nr:hypothetical protein CAQU_06300 [Corynebacterium aquilae DSM 44791]
MGEGSVLILGATSDIGGEIATLLCANRHIILAARRPEAAQQRAEQLRASGASSVEIVAFEATDIDSIVHVIRHAANQGLISCIVVAFGILGSQHDAEDDPFHAYQIAEVDYAAQVAAIMASAKVLSEQKTPATLVAFSSIAGFRARRANFVYGSTKAGVDALCQGLVDRLHSTAVQLIIARPGFVIGSMTAGMKPAPLSTTPDKVADAVVSAIASGRRGTLWIPSALRWLAYVMAVVPRGVWRRMPR